MESFSPDELTSRAKQQQEETSTLAGEIVRWFIQEKHLGDMYQRENVIQRLSEYTSSPVDKARNGLQSVIGDIVDPVQQIVVDGDRYVGAIEYIEFEDSGAYGYIHFDDRLGKRKRVVCAKCVQEETLDENVVHATQGQGSSDIDATWDELVNKVKAHYNRSHDSQPEEIYPGASLVSGTTIGGNGAYHKGNLADRGAVTISPSTNNQTIPEGYHNGNGFVEGDGGLTSGNIKNGVSIFGVNGSFKSSYDVAVDIDGTQEAFQTISSNTTFSGSTSVSGNRISADFSRARSSDGVAYKEHQSDVVSKMPIDRVEYYIECGGNHGSAALEINGNQIDKVNRPGKYETVSSSGTYNGNANKIESVLEGGYYSGGNIQATVYYDAYDTSSVNANVTF